MKFLSRSRSNSKEGLYENINYGSIKTQEYKIGLFDATNSSRINKTSFKNGVSGYTYIPKILGSC